MVLDEDVNGFKARRGDRRGGGGGKKKGKKVCTSFLHKDKWSEAFTRKRMLLSLPSGTLMSRTIQCARTITTSTRIIN